MTSDGAHGLRGLIALVALIVVAGCGGGADAGAATNGSSADMSADLAAGGPVELPDACTFLARAELEEIVGWELGEGESRDAPAGFSICEFDSPPLLYMTRTFPSPALARSVGFSSFTISTHPSDADGFAEFRQMLGPAVEDAPGIGDAAYFNGPDMLYARVGNRGFSVRIYTDAGSDAEWAQVRDVMLTVGRLGASRI